MPLQIILSLGIFSTLISTIKISYTKCNKLTMEEKELKNQTDKSLHSQQNTIPEYKYKEEVATSKQDGNTIEDSKLEELTTIGDKTYKTEHKKSFVINKQGKKIIQTNESKNSIIAKKTNNPTNTQINNSQTEKIQNKSNNPSK